jgi:hypothetical protein
MKQYEDTDYYTLGYFLPCKNPECNGLLEVNPYWLPGESRPCTTCGKFTMHNPSNVVIKKGKKLPLTWYGESSALKEWQPPSEINPVTVEIIPPAADLESLTDTCTSRTEQSSLNTQVGGSHYKDLGIQPVEYASANNLDYFQGNVVKYVTRWRNKNGVEDLKKALHYLEMYIELEEAKEKGNV